MKTMTRRVLIGASLFSLMVSGVVAIIGWARGWNTAIQFSDGLFWAGAILIFIGLISYQGYARGSMDGPAAHLDPDEQSSLSATDALRGKKFMAFLGLSGLLLLILSFLVARLV